MHPKSVDIRATRPDQSTRLSCFRVSVVSIPLMIGEYYGGHCSERLSLHYTKLFARIDDILIHEREADKPFQ